MDDWVKQWILKAANSFLAGGLVLAGAMTDGTITEQGLLVAIGASLIVGFMQFKKYLEAEIKDNRLGAFI